MKVVALVTDNILLEAQCREAMRRFPDLRLRRAQGLDEANRWALDCVVHGLLVDFRIFLRASAFDRDRINHLVEYIPVGKIRLTPSQELLTATFGDDNLSGEEVFEALALLVRRLPATRVLRGSNRRPVILNVKAFHPMWQNSCLLTNTVNISQGGLFLISATYPPLDTAISLEVVELPAAGRWQARIRWLLPWGKTTQHYPGFGLEFIDMNSAQREALASV